MTRALILSEHALGSWGERYARGEVPAPLELVGGVLVVGGVLWASRQHPIVLPEPEPLPDLEVQRI